jgi:hypothetical protein
VNNVQLGSDISVGLVGCLGAIGAETLHWHGLRRRARLPPYLKSTFYWIVTFVMVLLGGFVAWLRYGADGSALDVFATGLAAPIVLQKLISQAGRASLGSRGPEEGLRDFFIW